jgi:hypothetical protein
MTRFLRLAALAVALLCIPQSSRADFLRYAADLNGASQVPANASPGSGFAEVDVDTTANTMRVQVTFSNLLSTTTASHIHAFAPPGVNAGVATTLPTFPGFPLGVTSGTYDQTFDMTQSSSYNPAFITANGGTPVSAEAALFAGMAAGMTYLNIHTNVFPAGEIRGQLEAVPSPEPASLVLLAIGGLGIIAYRRPRESRTRA